MKKKRTKITVIIIVCFAAAFLFFIWMRAGAPTAQRIVGAPTRLFYALGAGLKAAPNFFKNRAYLKSENARLDAQVQKYAIDQAKYKSLEEDYAALSTLVGYRKSDKNPPVFARVIGYAPDPFVDSVIIDRGLQEGITLDAPVIVNDGIFVGKISKVWDHLASVRLVSDSHSKVAAKVLGREGAFGVLEGRGALFNLAMIPKTIALQIGDIVVTEISGTTMPAGLTVGTIASINADIQGPFQSALVSPLVSTKDISFVAVLKQLMPSL